MASDLSSRMPKISEVDLSGLNDWEKKRISSVMEKAQVWNTLCPINTK